MFIIQSTDLSHIFGCDLGVKMKENTPHYPQYSHDIIGIHPLKIYSDIVENKLEDDTKKSFTALYFFHFFCEDRRQYMIYQSFTKLQFRKFL